MSVSIGQVIADRYVVERVLGGGAMGLVVLGRDVMLGHAVAIKIVRDDAILEREEAALCLLEEARAAASIASEHVCRVFQVGTLPSGEPFMVMEHLEGNDLEQEIERRGELPIHEAVDYVLQAAEAIAAAHALGIVHRDLKPANLFLETREDGTRRLKVLDFGVAVPARGASLGTPAYMSPEQIRSPRDVDGRTDVWALGAILYELVTGQTAFVGASVAAVFDMVLHDDPCPIDVLRRNVPSELSAIVRRCLARERTERYPGVAELAFALLPFGTLSVVTELARGSLRAPSMGSVGPMVTAGRDTQPDADEILARDSIVQAYGALSARRRKAASAVRGLAVASALAGAVSVMLHMAHVTERAPAAAPVAAAPLPPARGVERLQVASNHVQTATDRPSSSSLPPVAPATAPAPPGAASAAPRGPR